MSISALIIDDDEKFRKILEIRLKSWNKNIQITQAVNLKQAAEILDQQGDNFNLVILDQHLPDGMGYELLEHPQLENTAVLAVSSDDAPELPAETVKAGARHFLSKHRVSEKLFIPLLEALIARSKLEKELTESRLQESRMQTIKTLLATLRHEINNPLGAVFGATYLLRQTGKLEKEQEEALGLIEESGKRIKHVLEQLCKAAELEQVTKAHEDVFQVPGDPKWEK